jgi:RimJ/RimL family protein N-acetyltransferase
MKSAAPVETERLLLRPWRHDDLEPLTAIFAKPEVWRFPYGRGFTPDETRAFLDRKIATWGTRGWSQWAAVLKPDRLIGFMGLEPPTFLPEVMPTVEIGWRLDPDCWGQGLASEGGAAGLRFAFDTLRLGDVVSIYEPANVASGKVMEHLGMQYDRDTVHPVQGMALRVYRLSAAQWHRTPH